MKITTPLFFCIFILTSAFAEETMTPDELKKWFYEDEPTPPIQVDEGELVFLEQLSDKTLLHSINEITIDTDSIDSGWVDLSQCYKNLDPVSEIDIVYSYRFMRNIKISSTVNIGAARVSEKSVVLEHVKEKAELCVTAQARVFYQNKDGLFSLVNGPYHRKFLDGYFPFHVTLIINYPENKLNHIANQPQEQKGFRIQKESNRLLIDAVFAGMLNTEIIFRKNE